MVQLTAKAGSLEMLCGQVVSLMEFRGDLCAELSAVLIHCDTDSDSITVNNIFKKSRYHACARIESIWYYKLKKILF